MRSGSTRLTLLVVIAAAILWLPPLSSSLWLDELDTYFSAKDGVWTAITRTHYVHPQCSQLYNVLMAIWIDVFGKSEWILRLPSVLAMTTAAYFVYRIGRLVLDRETGLLAALVFVTTRDVAFAAADARSYAFALAACIAATEAGLRFLAPRALFPDQAQSTRKRATYAVTYAVAAALTVYFHQLFGLVLLVHAGIGLWAIARGESTVTIRQALAVGVGTAAALAGEIPNLVTTFVVRERMVHGLVPPPEYLVYLWSAPTFVFAILPLAFLLYARRIEGSFSMPSTSTFACSLLLAWAVVPPAFLFVVSRLTDTHVFLPRYYLSCQPALALILAVILRGFDPPILRSAAGASIVVLAVVLGARSHHSVEDWQGVAKTVNAIVDDDTLVLIDSGFVEAANRIWLELPRDDDRYGFLTAPLSYYGFRGRTEVLPYRLSESTRGYFEDVLRPKLLAVERFVVVGRGREPRWWRLWLDGRFASDGYAARSLHESRYLEATVFERGPVDTARTGSRRPAPRSEESRSGDIAESAAPP